MPVVLLREPRKGLLCYYSPILSFIWTEHMAIEWKDLTGPAGVLIASIITQIVTVGILFANHRLSYRRYSKEKMWDLKREMYSKVLSKLSEVISAYISAQTLYLLDGSDDRLRANATEQENRTFPLIQEAQTLLRDNYVIFSREFTRKFDAIYDTPEVSEDDYGDELEFRLSLVRKLHDDLLEQARKELNTDT